MVHRIAILILALGILGCSVKKEHIPASFAQLAALSDEQLAKVDIALMNLLCAEGLPGADNLDIPECLKTLDQWAMLAKRNEKNDFLQFQKDPEAYDRSESLFKAVNLGLTIKDDLKCGYNMQLIVSGALTDMASSRFFRNSQDLFIHGLIQGKRGSCSSLPVLTVAVGRRCGYPLKLVTTKGHLFCRWDEGKIRHNIEMACPGVDSKPDSYYMSWPLKTSDAERKVEKHLQSLTPREEFGVFCSIRGSCLMESGRLADAKEAFNQTLRAIPESVYAKQMIRIIDDRIDQGKRHDRSG